MSNDLVYLVFQGCSTIASLRLCFVYYEIEGASGRESLDRKKMLWLVGVFVCV